MLATDKTIRDKKRRVTLLEIAKAAGVSKSTVSLVLNNSPNIITISEQTRVKIRDAAKILGFRPSAAAKSLATGRSNAVLVVAFDLLDEDLMARLKGAESYFVPRGYSLHLCTVDAITGVAGYREILQSGRADGVLLTGAATPSMYSLLRSVRDEADSLNIPIVALANAFPHDCIETVAHIDDVYGGQQATAHLIEHGHRRIVLLGMADQPWGEDRETGYRRALEQAGIAVDPTLIVLGERTQRWAYETTLRLLKSKDFTAMFITSDVQAVAALSAIRAAGKKVPGDYAIIGYNDEDKMVEYTDPPLTTVHNPFTEVGLAAAEMLTAAIEGQPVEPVKLPVSLVIRQSCGCTAADSD